MEKPADYNLFKFYWDSLCAKGMGNDWPPTKRHYVTMSDAVVGGTYIPNDKLFTAVSEGMLVTLYENNFEKWKKLKEWKQKNNNKKLPKRDKKLKNQQAWMNAKWSTNNEGQQEFGGWKDEGVDRFNEITRAIHKKRKKAAKNAKTTGTNVYVQVEKDFLAKLRNELQLTETTGELECRKCKRNGLLAAAVPTKKTKALTAEELANMSDSDDDETDVEGEEEGGVGGGEGQE
ncbi:MAG: hypothetical protein KJO73_12345 [Croceitalea sp.]|nr:hypothetical protein [Croceitalea sp.]